jgi:phosphoribosylformimino-5-aminoimidazole carboxamide ribotide isomerase
VDIAQRVKDWPLAGIIYTDIARDGALSGPNIAATRQLLEAAGQMPVIHSGGITSLQDIAALKALPLAGIIVGRALYEGRLQARQAVELLAAGS